jgi:hypothetical protein
MTTLLATILGLKKTKVEAVSIEDGIVVDVAPIARVPYCAGCLQRVAQVHDERTSGSVHWVGARHGQYRDAASGCSRRTTAQSFSPAVRAPRMMLRARRASCGEMTRSSSCLRQSS